jgi:hypothetical protein
MQALGPSPAIGPTVVGVLGDAVGSVCTSPEVSGSVPAAAVASGLDVTSP